MIDAKILSEINEILGDHPLSSRSLFTFYKSNKKWYVSYVENGAVIKSEHSSKIKAINSFFSKQPAGLNKFHIVVER